MKVRDDMLVHAKLELRKNAVDVFAYRHGGERFLAAMLALMARRYHRYHLECTHAHI